MNEQAPFVLLDEAAKLANVSRRTIDRDMRNGKISETQIRQEGGRKKIAIVELERVYGRLVTKTDLDKSPNLSQTEAGARPEGTNRLIEFLEEQIKLEQERTRNAEEAAERWEARFLAAQEKLNGFLLPPPLQKKKGLIARIFGKKIIAFINL